MTSVEMLMCVLCYILTVTESRYIPTRAHQTQSGQFLPSNRRAGNAAIINSYSNIHQRHSSQFRRNPSSLRTSRVQTVGTRQYHQNPKRHSSFDSIIGQSVRRISDTRGREQVRNPEKDHVNSAVRKMKKSPNNPNRGLNINFKFNDQSSTNDISKNTRRRITINAKNLLDFRISHAVQTSNIFINKLGGNTRIRISKTPTSHRQMKLISNSRKASLRGTKDGLKVPASTHYIHKENNQKTLSALNSNKEYEFRTLPPSAWYISSPKTKAKIVPTSSWYISSPKPEARIVPTSASYKRTSKPVSSISAVTAKPPAKPSATAPTKSASSTLLPHASINTAVVAIQNDTGISSVSSTIAPITSTVPATTMTEEIDLPDLPDLPDGTELPDTVVDPALHSMLD